MQVPRGLHCLHQLTSECGVISTFRPLACQSRIAQDRRAYDWKQRSAKGQGCAGNAAVFAWSVLVFASLRRLGSAKTVHQHLLAKVSHILALTANVAFTSPTMAAEVAFLIS